MLGKPTTENSLSAQQLMDTFFESGKKQAAKGLPYGSNNILFVQSKFTQEK